MQIRELTAKIDMLNLRMIGTINKCTSLNVSK